MRPRPAVKVTICLRVPELVIGQSQQNAIHDQTAVLVAGHAITTAPDFEAGDVFSKKLVEQSLGIGPFELQRIFTCVQQSRLASQQPVGILS